MGIVIREREKQIIYLAIFIVIVIADVFFILGWQFKLFFNYYKTTNLRKKAITTLKSDIINLDGYKREIAKLDEKTKDFNLLIADEKDISILIENVSNLANSSSVKIIQIRPVKDKSEKSTIKAKNSSFSQIVIQISARCDFHQLGNFMSKIETAKNFLKPASLEIQTDGKDYFVQNVKLSLISFVNTKNVDKVDNGKKIK